MVKLLYFQQVNFWLSNLSLGEVGEVISQCKEVTSVVTRKRKHLFLCISNKKNQEISVRFKMQNLKQLVHMFSGRRTDNISINLLGLIQIKSLTTLSLLSVT